MGPPVYGDETRSLIARIRAFTFSSRFEGFGNSAAEAAAMGRLTLVTRTVADDPAA